MDTYEEKGALQSGITKGKKELILFGKRARATALRETGFDGPG
jgi:hypothetical protein